MKRIICVEGIPCPKYKRNPCCYGCRDYESCDFEDKCELTPEKCGNDDYIANLMKEREL